MNINTTRKAISLITHALDVSKTTVPPIETVFEKPILKKSEKYFPRVKPEECGVDGEYVSDFVRKLYEDKMLGLQSLIMMRDGKVFYEANVGQQSSDYPRMTFSESKSIISLAIGALCDSGQLSLTENLDDIFADEVPATKRIRMKNITVRDLLTMQSTVTFNEVESMVSADWEKAFLSGTTAGEAGVTFAYNSLNTYMLASVIRKKTKQSVSEYLKSTIFGKLGIENFFWEKSPNGTEKGGWGLYIAPEDLLKIGKLVMDKGVWEGKRVISAKYIAAATKAHAAAPKDFGNYNYGYHIWVGRSNDTFLFNGMLGQNLLGFRENGIIILINSSNGFTFQQCAFFPIAEEFFGKEFPESLPTNRKAEKKLSETTKYIGFSAEKRKKSILTVRSTKRDSTKDIKALDGVRFEVTSSNACSTGFSPLIMQMIQNNYTRGLKEIRFSADGKKINAEFVEADESHVIKVGFDKPVMNEVSFHGEKFSVSAFGRFCDSEDGIPVLRIECAFAETPYERIYRFYFEEGNYRAEFSETPTRQFISLIPDYLRDLTGNNQMAETLFAKFDKDFIEAKFEKATAPKITLSIL